MKKAILILATFTFLTSCSKTENCTGNYNEINQSYQTQIDYEINNPFGGVIDNRKITILKQERDKKLSTACR